MWGYEVKPDQERLHYLKLLLDPRQQLPSYIQRADLEAQLERDGKTVAEAVSQYLTLLQKEAKDALTRRYGESMVGSTTIDYVLTVPAVWSDAAKDATLQAARIAQLSPITMVSEPEAAAIYALGSMKNHALGVGDNFIVCDAGGGTVDLVAYEIRSTSPLRLKESAPGTGALCGAAFLNMRFQNLVRTRMGPDLFDHMCMRKPKSWAIAFKYFEDYIKRTFDPSASSDVFDDNKFSVPLPGAADNLEAGIDCGFLTLSTADVGEIFRPLVDHVIELVERQRQIVSTCGKTARGVILVGGFGQSNHLFKSLKTRFADEDPPPPYSRPGRPSRPDATESRFVIHQPLNAWTAVVRGAVLHGMENTKAVLSRIARRHYGVACSQVFNAAIHSQRDKYWDPIGGEYRADHQTIWHIKKGGTLLSGEPIMVDMTWQQEPDDTEMPRGSLTLIVSDEEEAPKRFEPSQSTRKLCVLPYNTRHVTGAHWEIKRSSACKAYRRLDFKIGMEVQSGGLRFDCRVNGGVVGTVTARFE